MSEEVKLLDELHRVTCPHCGKEQERQVCVVGSNPEFRTSLADLQLGYKADSDWKSLCLFVRNGKSEWFSARLETDEDLQWLSDLGRKAGKALSKRSRP